MPYSLLTAYPTAWFSRRRNLPLSRISHNAAVLLQLDSLSLVKKLKNKIPTVLIWPEQQIRIGKIKANGLVLLKGQQVALAGNNHLHNVNVFNWHEQVIPLTGDISEQVKISDRIFINHGQVILIVRENKQGIIRAEVSRGGKVASNSLITYARQQIAMDLSSQVIDNLKQQEVDYLALPAGKYKNIVQAKKIIGKDKAKLVLKISQLKQLDYLGDAWPLIDGVLFDALTLATQVPTAKMVMIEKQLNKLAQEKKKVLMIYGRLK